MPLLEVERVLSGEDAARPVPAALAQALADAAGAVFGSAPGKVWVRLRALPATAYAENGVALPADALPVFVTLLHARPPSGDALDDQVRSLTDALAAALGIAARRVHVLLAPPGAGRQAFGGQLVR